MKTSDRQKMCPSCEGMISVDVVVCPYCTTDLSSFVAKESPSKAALLKNKALQDASSALYTPSYTSETEGKREFKQVVNEPARSATAPQPIKEQKVDALFPILAFCVGGVLLTLGLMQFFFSENGMLTLEWDVQYWYIYCLIAAPLIFFGFKKIGE